MESQKIFNVIVIVVLLAIIVLNSFLVYKSLTTTSQQYTQTPDSALKQKIIQVSGTGTAATRPDITVVYLGVKIQAQTASKAQEDNALVINSVLDAVKKAGIAETDIEPVSYTLEPVMIYPENETPKIVGYVCRNELAVTLHDISKTGTIIDQAVGAGANEINSIQFRISDDKTKDLYQQALKSAIADADNKAETISKSLNVKLLGPIQVNVGSSYTPIPLSFDSKAGTQIIPGELKVTVDVQVSYQYQ